MSGLCHLPHYIFSISTTTRTAISATSSLPILSLHSSFFKSSSSLKFQRRNSIINEASQSLSNMEPPVAKKVKHEMEMFGDVRVDNYYWLRDDSRTDPQILAHLRDENAYADHVMSGLIQTLSLSLSVG